jgi:hypothetical protein
VGEVKKREKDMTIDVVQVIESLVHEERSKTLNRKTKRRIAEMIVWIVGGFCIGLGGKKMLLIEFAGTAKSLKHTRNDRLSHFVFSILGRTKGNQR